MTEHLIVNDLMPNTEMQNYKTLIDEQTWAFIHKTDSCFPPEAIDFTIQLQRETYDAMCREFSTGQPESITATDGTIENGDYKVPVRRYHSENRNQQRAIIYFHGGGFIVGSLDSHDDVCTELCANTGFDVTSVDYRLAPENPHPAAFEDSLACVEYESNRLRLPIILCGDSAGGNLAAAISHAARHMQNVHIARQVLIYPGLGGDTDSGSYLTHANAPMLTTRDVLFYNDTRTNNIQRSNDVTLEPLKDHDFSNLPETIVFGAECDPLSDDGKHYCQAITAAGGSAHWTNEKGLVHGYLRARNTVDRARDSFSRIIAAIKTVGNSTGE